MHEDGIHNFNQAELINDQNKSKKHTESSTSGISQMNQLLFDESVFKTLSYVTDNKSNGKGVTLQLRVREGVILETRNAKKRKKHPATSQKQQTLFSYFNKVDKSSNVSNNNKSLSESKNSK